MKKGNVWALLPIAVFIVFYLGLGIIYLCLTLPITFVSKYLERKFKYEN